MDIYLIDILTSAQGISGRLAKAACQPGRPKCTNAILNTGRGPDCCLVMEKSNKSFRAGDRHNSFNEFTRIEPTEGECKIMCVDDRIPISFFSHHRRGLADGE
ncbi:hypothetical protein HW555_005835 [Spodoptera exigua]|uniref:Uncharacterized protein n=1 Tax=Spodoptera exigua TaxID=7107 RepID=A0A835GH98_SPOEX|nr:hypothetical protein HW555_005835 [Spodoptera exigua]